MQRKAGNRDAALQYKTESDRKKERWREENDEGILVDPREAEKCEKLRGRRHEEKDDGVRKEESKGRGRGKAATKRVGMTERKWKKRKSCREVGNEGQNEGGIRKNVSRVGKEKEAGEMEEGKREKRREWKMKEAEERTLGGGRRQENGRRKAGEKKGVEDKGDIGEEVSRVGEENEAGEMEGRKEKRRQGKKGGRIRREIGKETKMEWARYQEGRARKREEWTGK